MQRWSRTNAQVAIQRHTSWGASHTTYNAYTAASAGAVQREPWRPCAKIQFRKPWSCCVVWDESHKLRVGRAAEVP